MAETLTPHPTMVVTAPDGRTRPVWIFHPDLLAERAATRRAALAAWVDTQPHTFAERDAWRTYQAALAADPAAH